MHVARNITPVVQQALTKVPAVAILGPRQVGKTTLARRLIDEGIGTIYLDLERPSDLRKLSDAEIYLQAHVEERVIIDEVQRKLDLFPLLRALIDAQRVPGRFVLLGSASHRLIASASESLAGRVRYFDLEPFNMLEVSDVQKLWLQGGFPEAFLEDVQDGFEWLGAFVRSYIERELAMVNLRINPAAFERFIQIVASVHGQPVNYNALGRATGLSHQTVRNYLDFVNQSYLIRTIHPYFTNVKKRLVKSPKIYVRDTGILHHLRGITTMEALQGDMLKGASWEGFVIQQIISMLDAGNKPYYYRTSHGAELDLVVTRANQVMATFEIKYSNSPSTSKGLLSAVADLGATDNFVVTPYADEYPIRENILVIPIARLYHHLKRMGLTLY